MFQFIFVLTPRTRRKNWILRNQW